MNVIIIGAAGYILLLSNIILLMLLIRKRFKCQLVSSFYILSASDVLNSVLTAIILLINYTDMTNRTNDFDAKKFILNTYITEKYSNTFFQFYKAYNSSDLHYYNQTSCNVKDLLMQNAMFLMPFTNAFISLLVFSMQCNLNTICINNKYKNYLQFRMKAERNSFMDTVNTNSRDEELNTKQETHKHLFNITKIKDKMPHVFQNIKFRNTSEMNKRIVGVSILSQWLIPIFFTSVLYFADYQNIGMILQNKSAECMYETSFSFYNCFLEDKENTQSQFSLIPIYTDYINNSSLIPLHNQNITEDDVISKVYDIMHLALNYTYDSSTDPQISTFSNNYELSQLKRHINTNISTNDITNKINITNVETNYNEWIIKDGYSTENNMSTSENIIIVKDNYEDTKLSETLMLYSMSKCVISTKFFKLYFFVLMFIIYFLPIILSSVLQVRGELVYQNVLSKLKEQNSEVYPSPHNKMYIDHNKEVNWKSKLPSDSHSSKEYNNEEQGKNNTKIISDHANEQEKIYKDVLKESAQVEKLFGAMKVSLIISIILWTPIFLQAALQVFLCICVSTWIIDCTFSCAISSCIIRNIFNLKMAKTQEIQRNLLKKENTVHPTEENI